MSEQEKTKIEKPVVATVQSFRKKLKEPKMIFLPVAGVVIEVVRLTPLDYIEGGFKDIPNEFFKFIGELGSGKVNPDDEEAKRNYELYEKFLKITIEKGVVNPPTILTYDEAKKDTHLIFGEFAEDDQKYLVDVISGRLDG